RLRVAQLAAARQLELQECAVTLQCNGAAADDTAALMYGGPGGSINLVPKALDLRMRRTPFGLDLLALGFAKCTRRKFLDGVGAALISARKIAGFSVRSFVLIGRDRALRNVQHPAGENAVGLVLGIPRRVVATIGIELPLFAGNPGQHPAFN